MESGTTDVQGERPAAAPRKFPVVAVALLCLGIAGLLWSVVLEGQRSRPVSQGRTAPDSAGALRRGEVRLADLRGRW
jgi:hypothetical protein